MDSRVLDQLDPVQEEEEEEKEVEEEGKEVEQSASYHHSTRSSTNTSGKEVPSGTVVCLGDLGAVEEGVQIL